MKRQLKLNIKLIAMVIILLVIVALIVSLYVNERKKAIEKANYLYIKGLHEFAVALETGDFPRLKRAHDLFDSASKAGKGDIAILSKLMKAKVLLTLNRKEEATKIAKEALRELPDSHPLKAIFLPIGQDEELFKKFLESKKIYMEDYARYEYALLLLEKNKKGDAKNQLDILKKKYPDSPFTSDLEKIMEVSN